jgi:hypothetical protein
MPSSNQVLCAHCNVWMSRKREREHRGLLFTPYASPPKLSSRFTRLLDSDSEEDSSIPDLRQDGPSSKFGQNEVQSDYDQPPQTDGSFDDNDNEFEADQSLEVDDDILVVRDVRWGAMLGDKTRPDNEDSDSDLEEDPVEDAGDEDDDGYDDWAAIEAEFGLSAWDKLGEGFEQEIAGIGTL